MCRYTVMEIDRWTTAYTLVTNGYYPVGSIITDPRDGSRVRILRIEGGAYNGKREGAMT